jgi:phage host-nuclease inhibitor protein Gam
MEAMRSTEWTDNRLDDLNGKVDHLRTEMKSEIKDLRSDFNGKIDDLRTEMKSEIKGLRSDIWGLRAETTSRFDSFQRTMILLFGGMTATLAAGFLGLIATQL